MRLSDHPEYQTVIGICKELREKIREQESLIARQVRLLNQKNAEYDQLAISLSAMTDVKDRMMIADQDTYKRHDNEIAGYLQKIKVLEGNTQVKSQECRVCGCTDKTKHECFKITGELCHWVEDDLCSRCRDETRQPFLSDGEQICPSCRGTGLCGTWNAKTDCATCRGQGKVEITG